MFKKKEKIDLHVFKHQNQKETFIVQIIIFSLISSPSAKLIGIFFWGKIDLNFDP